MPGRRTVKRGSFGGHFDELVKNFPHEQPGTRRDSRSTDDQPDHNVHDRLFEHASRHHGHKA